MRKVVVIGEPTDTLYEGKEQLAESMILNPGHPNQFALGFTLPTDALRVLIP